MEKVIEELDEAKAEIEKLRADIKCKAELSENLKKAHHEQTIQIQQSKLKIEKQTQELNEKAEEITVARHLSEDLQSRLNGKESIIRHLSTTSEKLRVAYDERQREWESEKQRLVLVLDEANEKGIDQEQKIHVFMAEIEGLKGLLSASKTKCLEAEKRAKAQKEVKERDDMLLKLEEDKRTVEEQLKWKKEQFKHLEEAHEKLRNHLKESKKEWEREKSTLIDEICSLQTSLDSQTRISEDLQNRLKICNQALAHEESRRKYLEVEISEFKTRFENVFTECQEAKSRLECLSTQRDKEIAALRHSLGTKETFYKEIVYQAGKLEQENQELLTSLKELQEAQIQEAGNFSTVAKLRNKLKNLEQIHKDCSANLRDKEAEWSSQLQKLNGVLNNCRSALDSTETAVKELKMELDNCHSAIMQLELQNEEASVMLLVLKTGISEAQCNLRNADVETSLHDKERDENMSLLMNHLEMKDNALCKALEDSREERENVVSLLKRAESLELVEQQQLRMQKELERCKEMLQESSESHLHFKKQALQTERGLKEKIAELCDAVDTANAEILSEREKAATLSRKVACLDIIEEKRQLTQKELERYKEMLEESSRCQLRLEEKALLIETDFQETLKEVSDALDSANSELCEEREKTASLLKKENDFQEKLQELSDALERSNSELAAKTYEGHAVEYELWIWESIAQRLKTELQENQALRKELEASLLAEVGAGETIKKEKDSRIEDLQHRIELLEQELQSRMEKGMCFDSEKENLLRTMEEKDKILEDLQKEISWLEHESLRREFEGAIVTQMGAERIEELVQLPASLEQKHNCTLISLSSELAKKQAEISFVHEAWEKIAAAEILAQLEIEEKKLMIVELEDDISCIQQRLEAQEKSLSSSQQQALEIEAELEAKQVEMKKLMNVMETKLRTSEAFVDELKIERINLVEDVMKLSAERENLMDCVVELSDKISHFSDEDMQLAENLERMVQYHGDIGPISDLKADTSLFKHVSEIEKTYPSPTRKRFQVVKEERSPFRELN